MTEAHMCEQLAQSLITLGGVVWLGNKAKTSQPSVKHTCTTVTV